MKKLVIGILAHVDAGKTTLSEALLYLTGKIRKMGRVDKGDAFLDTYELERARGITIFSKQALISMRDTEVTLLDTPGHVDFSAEMERTLQVLDYAILVISGADGVQGHTRTLWRLLKQYGIPVFLFINKMDQPGTDQEKLLAELRDKLEFGCIDFREGEQAVLHENIAMCEEGALDAFIEKGRLEQEEIVRLICDRHVFPCFFGSALKLEGVDALIEGLETYCRAPAAASEFGARIFKISRDEQGNRLTYMKVTGGVLRVKAVLTNQLQEKINQIRIYSGTKYEVVNDACAGTVCAVTGPLGTYPGEGLGAEGGAKLPLLTPVLTYQLQLPEGCDPVLMLPKLRQLEEEEPQLHIVWNEKLKEIQAKVMGEVQIEVLKSMIAERYGVEVSMGSGHIVYRETIRNRVEGVGHFEPLKHYAEVHLLMEPGEPGSGLVVASDCSEDMLDRNWQRLVLTHLEEKEYAGVLTGSPITDMKITLIAGKAHLKHTEGGDFRQATYRAVRQGLMQASCVLLEPYYEFQLEVPEQMAGRAMADLERMYGEFAAPVFQDGTSLISGSGPVVTMRNYQREVVAYSKGHGRLSCSLKGYEPCHNTAEVMEQLEYDCERDSDNPSGSVFCAHGAGFVVNWAQVKEYMHVEGAVFGSEKREDGQPRKQGVFPSEGSVVSQWIGEDEVEKIISQTFYANSKKKVGARRWKRAAADGQVTQAFQPALKTEKKEPFLLIDGYNIIFAWDHLKDLAVVTIDGARERLLEIMCNYQAMRGCNLIVVFDAYRVQGHVTEVLDYHNIHVVFTKEAETADQYIEKFAQENGKRYDVTVATSDGLEQIIILGSGCRLLSAREFLEEVKAAESEIREGYLKPQPGNRNFLLASMSEEDLERLKSE